MTDLDRNIDAALLSKEPISKDQVVRWIDIVEDIPTLSKLYRLTYEAYSRIQPELGQELTCALTQRYLLKCIKENIVDSEEIEDRWESARTLHAWFCQLAEMESTSVVLKNGARAVTELFLSSGEDVRNAIEQGFLEHVLEMESLRPYFENWSSDDRLRETWERAIEWGKAHPG